MEPALSATGYAEDQCLGAVIQMKFEASCAAVIRYRLRSLFLSAEEFIERLIEKNTRTMEVLYILRI